MPNKIFAILYFAVGLAVYALPTKADVLVNDDLIIQGSQCVGVDCVDGLDFAGDTLRLQENNLRIRLHDTSAPDLLGQSWNLLANSSANGGNSNFSFELKSLVIDTIQFSDGTAPLYDCSVGVPSPFTDLPPIIGFIPFGDQVTFPQNSVFDSTTSTFIYECLTVPDYTIKPILSLGTTADSNVTLGFDSQAETGAISVGSFNLGLVRNLKNVAVGIAQTDLLITQTLNDYSAFGDQESQLASLQGQVGILDALITDIEDKVFNNQAPTAPNLTSPDNNAINMDTTVTFRWEVSTDANGDTLRYSVTVCEMQDFSGCTPEVVASTGMSMMYAGLGGGTGMLLLVGLVLPNARNRRRQWVYGACVVSTVILMTACGGGGNPPAPASKSHTVTGLSLGTQYYWKVTATDFIDSTDSEVRNLTTL